ncbi:HYR domain-containing protein, partial [Flavobacterium taihuense]
DAPSTFPIGSTTVTWTVKDASNNTATCTQTVTITDNINPTITCPAAVSVNVDAGSCVATGVALGSPVFADNCSGATVSNDAPSTFPIGSTIVTWTVKDASNNTATCTQTVTITDNINPTITCPAAVSVNVDAGSCVATGVALGSPVFADNCSGATVSNDAPSTFPIGSTIVTWTVKDASNNTATCTQTVTITDNINPTITCPAAVSVNVDAGSCVATGVALGSPVFADNCSGATVSNDAPSTFPIGSTIVTWTVKDASNNTTSCTQTVKVIGEIIANDDLGTPINGTVGGTALVDIISNDQLNCAIVNPNDVVLSFISATNAGVSLVGRGVIVAPNTPAGSYSLTYSICDKLNPTNCDTAKVTVQVNTIDAIDDTMLPIIGSSGGTTENVLFNDKVNGTLLTAATFNTVNVSSVGVYPTGLSLNMDGTLTVAPGTTAGKYAVQYQICSVSSPAICDTASINIEVKDVPAPAPPIVLANDDSAGPIDGLNGMKNILNVLSNDLVDVNSATLSNVNLSVVTPDATGYLTLNTDGSLDIKRGTPVGTYSLTYQICTLGVIPVCDAAAVSIVVNCSSATYISGIVYNKGNASAPLANVPITLIPQKTTVGPVLMQITKADGSYSFSGMVQGDYLVQVQDANLNSVYQLYPTNGSLRFITVNNCDFQKIDFEYDLSTLPVLGDYVWYDINSNGIQDEWYDANNDGLVTQNIPDANGNIDYSKWEWIDYNGDGSCKGANNVGELNAAGIGNAKSSNIVVTGPNGYSKTVIIGYEGYWRDRPGVSNPWGDYKVELVMDANLDAAAQALGGTGLVKVLPSTTKKGVDLNVNKMQGSVVCGLTTPSFKLTNLSTSNSVYLDGDFGISCRMYAGIVANSDNVGAIDGSKALNGIFNVIANDTFNGLPIHLSDVVLSFTPDPNFTIGTNGLLNTIADIPGGNYTLTYSICEKANPSNCSTALVTVFVEKPSIALVKTAHFNDENGDGYAKAGETITYSFEITNTGNVPLTNVIINDPLLGVIMSGNPLIMEVDEINTTNFKGRYVIKQSDINTGSISNQATVYGTSPNGQIVEDKSDELNILDDNPTVLSVSGCAIKVFNSLTPDGGDKYDRLFIQGLECYPDNSVEIFNRWGVLVFEREHYNNDDRAFKGVSEGRVTVEKSQELPVGTYFYILKYKDSESNALEKSGYLYLNRK